MNHYRWYMNQHIMLIKIKHKKIKKSKLQTGNTFLKKNKYGIIR